MVKIYPNIVGMCLINAHHTLRTLTVYMSHCYHLLYSLQYTIDGLCDAAGDGRLEDVKECLQNGVNVNGSDQVSSYTYFMLISDQLATTYNT